jgi:hypothetical protein
MMVENDPTMPHSRAVLRTPHRILHGLLADFTRFALVDIGHAA